MRPSGVRDTISIGYYIKSIQQGSFLIEREAKTIERRKNDRTGGKVDR